MISDMSRASSSSKHLEFTIHQHEVPHREGHITGAASDVQARVGEWVAVNPVTREKVQCGRYSKSRPCGRGVRAGTEKESTGAA